VIFFRHDTDAMPPMPANSDSFVRAVGYLGAAANWLIPISGIAALGKDPAKIDSRMSAVLSVYSFFFVRWSLAISPANYPLFACHTTNCTIQAIQTLRGITAKKE